MNSRTTETRIVWKLELTSIEDAVLCNILEEITKHLGDDETYALSKKLLSLVPKGGDDEEKPDDDLDFDLGLDDFDRRSAIHDATMGVPTNVPTADAADPAEEFAERYTKHNATRLWKLAHTCRGECDDPKPEDFNLAAQRSAQSEWDKGSR